MTSMTKCPTCQQPVSTKATACPKCGHQFKAPGGINLRDPVHVIGCLLVVVFVVAVVGYIIASS